MIRLGTAGTPVARAYRSAQEMSDADFELLLAMAEDAEHAAVTCPDVAQSPSDDLSAGAATTPHAPQCQIGGVH